MLERKTSKRQSIVWTVSALCLCAPFVLASRSSAAPPSEVLASESPTSATATLAPQAKGGRAAPTVEEAPPNPPFKEVAAKELRDARAKSIALLVEMQEAFEKGGARAEWPYEGVYRVGGKIPLGYRIGGTSICADALLRASQATSDATAKKARPAQGAGESARAPSLAPNVRTAVERALTFVLERLKDPLMSADFVEGYDVRGWGHAYALEFLLRARACDVVPTAQRAAVEEAIDTLVTTLETSAIASSGGWNYSRAQGPSSAPSTFMTASTLQILFEAHSRGEAVDAQVIERGLKALELGRLDTGAFQYTSSARKSGKGIEDVPGAVGRMPVCETTLFLAGRGSVERIRTSIDAFFEHWRWLEQRRRKNGTHIPPYQIAPYYFFFAQRHAAQAIEFLPEEERGPARAKLASLFWHVREPSGGWNDRVFPRSENYGTAMALLALLEPDLARPAGWTAAPRTEGDAPATPVPTPPSAPK